MQNVMHRKFRAQAYVEHYGALFSYDTNDTKSKNSGPEYVEHHCALISYDTSETKII